MSVHRITQARVDNLKPRKSVYYLHDPELTGFGLRVLPSGRKTYFVRTCYQRIRYWKPIGEAALTTAADARSQATELLIAIRDGEENATSPNASFEAIAEQVFASWRSRWKSRTLAVNLNYYKNHILPRFGGRRISDITNEDIRCWIGSLRDKPTAADRSLPILSVIMRQAEIYGERPEDSNPCKGIKRYRRQGRERFLSQKEIRRLSEILDRRNNAHPRQACFIRLLLLTGCRMNEIRTLK